jgi:exopolyphosphatase/pppGpp-phosphohydrolase
MTTTWLHVGAAQSEVRSAAAVLQLAIGSAATAAVHFRHDPPTGPELEHAIDAVEEEVMRARTLAAGASSLVASGGALREVAVALGAADSATLEAVEQLFQRLASSSLGQPAARRGLPEGPRFIATVLILREFMHHLGFTSVRFAAR